VLVTMPFASFRQPSLALGLLKASLVSAGERVTVVDATLTLAEMIGSEIYDLIATWQPQDLLGDWIFSAAISQSSAHTPEQYERDILAGGLREHDVPFFGKMPLTDGLRGELADVRRGTGEFLERCLADVAVLEPSVVGFTSMFHQTAASLALAERVKAVLPETFVVLGGASCRGETGRELLFRFPFMDAVATGEGEAVLPELVRRLARGQRADDIPGLLTAEHREVGERPAAEHSGGRPLVGLDSLPLPDYGDYFARLVGGGLNGTFTPRLPFETSRGCWWGQRHRCVFCGQASGSLKYRRKSGERSLTELEELARRHPESPVVVTDEIVSPHAFRDFFRHAPARVPGLLVLYLEVRPGLSKDRLGLLARAGVRRLEAGVENLSSSVLKLMRKGTTGLQGVELLKWARELGIEVVWNYLWGLPGEDPAEYERVAGLIPLITHLQPPNSVGTVRVDRFSPLFEDPDRFGISGLRPYPAYGYVYDLPPESLSRLAYFFTFDAVGQQDVDRYTAPLAESIARWKEIHTSSMVAYSDAGDQLVVFEKRPGYDEEEVTVLDGEHLHLFLACDGVRKVSQLARELSVRRGSEVTTTETQELLDEIVEQGLMLREESSYLSLALPLPPQPVG
jgi:ribosomal peptide maturation radical SAM protein 1